MMIQNMPIGTYRKYYEALINGNQPSLLKHSVLTTTSMSLRSSMQQMPHIGPHASVQQTPAEKNGRVETCSPPTSPISNHHTARQELLRLTVSSPVQLAVSRQQAASRHLLVPSQSIVTAGKGVATATKII